LDIEKNSLLSFENKTKDRPREIGGTIGPLISKEGIDTVIASDIGPSAFNIFKGNGIRIFQTKGVVEEAVRLLKEGKLKELTKPTVPRYSDWKKKQ
jgi:predicted Fe-Mo cluster-binding NifX family protein